MLKPPLRRILPAPLTLLSAALIVFSFPPWNHASLVWFALVPWLLALEAAEGRREAIVQGIWLSFFMSVGGFYWVATVLHEFGELPWPIAALGLMLYALGGQPQFPLFAWAFKSAPFGKKSRRFLAPLFGALWVTLAYTAIDWACPKLFVDTLGHCFYQSERLRQLADVGGAQLLTFLVFLVNHSLYGLVRYFRGKIPRPAALQPLAISALALVAALVYGDFRHKEITALIARPKSRVQFAVIQPNIGDIEKIASERGLRAASEKVLTTLFEMSDRALALTPKPEVLVWPETSYPSTFRTPQSALELSHDQMIEGYVKERKSPLLFGGYDRVGRLDFNAFFFLTPYSDPGLTGTGDMQVYRKNILLLFGEYIPGAEQFQFLKDAFPKVGNFGRGAGPSVVTLQLTPPGSGKPSKTVGISPIICYEALFPNYVIGAARKGAQMILNITNDSWFGPHGEPELHISLAAFRSIETRLPQLRGTNTGISALIDADGEIIQPTAVDDAVILNTSVPILDPVPTLMVKLGDWFGPTSASLLALLWLCPWAVARLRKSRPT